MPSNKQKNTDFWPLPQYQIPTQQNPMPKNKQKKKRVAVIDNMPTAKEKAAEKRAIAEKQAITEKKAAIKEAMQALLSLQLTEKSPSPGSNISLLNVRRVSSPLQRLLTLPFPLSEEASNAQLTTLKAQTDELLEPLLLRDHVYSSEDEDDDDKHPPGTPYFRSEATITEFSIEQFRQQEKILKSTFETFWKSNHLGFFVSERLDFVPAVPSCTHIETLSDLRTCSLALNRRITEIHAILKDWEESKKMLSRPDPEWEEEQRKLIALKEKLSFIKNRVDGLITHPLFRFLYQASRRILLAEANHSIARQRREAEDKRQAEITEEVPKKSKAIPMSLAFVKPPDKEINTSHSKTGFWMRVLLFVIAFITSIFLALELTTEWLALSTITSAAIPILIGLTALSWVVGIISVCSSWCQSDRGLDDNKENIVKALPIPTNPHLSEKFPETSQSFSQHTLKEKEKENSNHDNDQNDLNTASENSPAFF